MAVGIIPGGLLRDHEEVDLTLKGWRYVLQEVILGDKALFNSCISMSMHGSLHISLIDDNIKL